MKRSIPLIPAILLGSVALAVAQTAAPAAVVIPDGSWSAQLLQWLDGVAVAALPTALIILCRKLPGPIADFLQSRQVEQMLSRSLDYGFGAVEGAVQGKTLDLNTSNAVLQAAANYVIANGPALAQKLGDTLKPKLLARLSAAGSLPADASAVKLGATVPPAAK